MVFAKVNYFIVSQVDPQAQPDRLLADSPDSPGSLENAGDASHRRRRLQLSKPSPPFAAPSVGLLGAFLKKEVGSQKGPIFRVAQFLRREEPRQQDRDVM